MVDGRGQRVVGAVDLRRAAGTAWAETGRHQGADRNDRYRWRGKGLRELIRESYNWLDDGESLLAGQVPVHLRAEGSSKARDLRSGAIARLCCTMERTEEQRRSKENGNFQASFFLRDSACGRGPIRRLWQHLLAQVGRLQIPERET